MRSKVHIVVNDFGEDLPIKLANYYLENCTLSFSTEVPDNPSDFKLIILWNIKKIIKQLPDTSNVVVFHSSNLPEGRGWAPIYYAIANSEPKHTITAILASSKVDAGDIICKGSFSILNSYNADDLRALDECVCFLMAKKIIDRFKDGTIKGYPQIGTPTYNKRRYPSDSIIDINQPLAKLIPHIKACPRNNQAYFDQDGVRFRVQLTSSEKSPTIPADLKIDFGN